VSPHTSTSTLAKWTDGAGHTQEFTSAIFMCLAPLEPKNFAGVTEDGGFETTFRCRDCAGCRNYELLILRRRLVIYFEHIDKAVWCVEFDAAGREPASISAAIARLAPEKFLPGFLPAGENRIAKLYVGRKPPKLELGRSQIRQHKPKQIARPRTSKAWKHPCRGMRRERAKIGANRNRYYLLGLPKLPSQGFLKMLQGGIRKRHPEARQGVRAWRRGFSLYPSEVQQGKEVLASLLAQISARGSRLTVNRRLPKAIAPMLDFPENSTRAMTSGKRDTDRSVSGRGGASCPTSLSGEWLAWAEKMIEKARKSGRT
jgi:hypothetical protein